MCALRQSSIGTAHEEPAAIFILNEAPPTLCAHRAWLLCSRTENNREHCSQLMFVIQLWKKSVALKLTVKMLENKTTAKLSYARYMRN